MMNLLFALIQGFWVIIPAYVANATAPLAEGDRRMDFGKGLWGNDLLGAGKTWKGFIAAIVTGTLAGAVEVWARPFLNPIALEEGFSLAPLTLSVVLLISLGAMLGDLVASFLKRRAGLKRGAHAPLLDQLDFLAGGFAAASLFVPISIESIVLWLVITPAIHFLSNIIGHELGAKEVPW